MKVDSNVALLIGVLALSVLLVSAVQSGRVSGVVTPGPFKAVGLTVDSNTLVRTKVMVTTTVTQGGGGGSTIGTLTTQATTAAAPPSSGHVDILSSGWLVVILAASLVLIGALYLRLPSKAGDTVDLEGDFSEMHRQTSNLEEGTDYKVRNAALVRYYALVRKVCSKVGIADGSDETPSEYIGRLSSRLSVDSGQAQNFAEVVNEAMYGAELGPERVKGLSGFMGDFVENIRRVALA